MPVGAGFIPARIGENKKMTEHKKLQPEIRFAGFTDDWEQRKLGDICNITTGKLDANAMVENGKYDFFTSGIKKYKIDHYAFLGPALTIAGNGTTVGYMHYADGFFNAYQRTYVLTELLGDRTFLFSTINRKLQKKIQQEARAGNIPYIVLDMLTELDIYLPSLEEQTQIGNFFKQLDDTIALHQGTLEKYQKLKISYLEKMFPKGNERYPELRFPNFTDAWEQRKLGEVVNVLDNLRIPIAASQRLEGVTPYYGANGIQGYIDGFTHDGEFVLVAEDGANDLINYPVQYVSGKVWINNHAHVLQGIKNVANNLFLVYRIKSMDMTKYLVGGGRTKLNASVMKGIELHLPNYAEQTQIGNFFKQLDDTIALHQREVEKYKKIKQSYLEKMFI